MIKCKMNKNINNKIMKITQKWEKFLGTQHVGTGVLFAADIMFQAKGPWIYEALHSMR